MNKGKISKRQKLRKFLGTTQGLLLMGILLVGFGAAAGVLMSNLLTTSFDVTDAKPLDLSFPDGSPSQTLAYRNAEYYFDLQINNTDETNGFDFILLTEINTPGSWMMAGQVVLGINGSDVVWDTSDVNNVFNQSADMYIGPGEVQLLNLVFLVDEVADVGGYALAFSAHGVVAGEEAPPEEPPSPSWLAGFDYRQNHTITASAGAGINYTTSLRLWKGSGTSVSGNMYCNDHVNNDFSDIRFTNNIGNLLPYWIEEKVDGSYADVWIKMTDDLSTEDFYLLCYYGNTTATSQSDVREAFWFGEDFETDVTQWDTSTGNIVDLTTYLSSIGNIQGSTGYYFSGADALSKVMTIGSRNFLMHTYWACNNMALGGRPLRGLDGESDNVDLITITGDRFWSYASEFPSSANLNTLANTWLELELFVDFDNNEITLWYNGANQGTLPLQDGSANAINSLTSFGQSCHSSANAASDVYTIRPYVSVEPQHSAWGTEEVAP